MLKEGIIDIYYTQVNRIDLDLKENMLAILNNDEKKIYKRYRLNNCKDEFIIGRYLLKSVLAYYLKEKPININFMKNEYGKIYLADNNRIGLKNPLQFNLSHSHGLIVCAVTLNYEIGIDVEKVGDSLTAIAQRFYSSNEMQFIYKQQLELKKNAMYRIWTLKEAFLKAKGVGFALGLESFDVLKMEDMYFDTFTPLPEYYVSVAVKNKKKIKFTSQLRGFSMKAQDFLCK